MIKNVIEYFVETVKKCGDKIAVVEGEKKITFSDLDKKGQILGHQIVNLVNDVNKPIAVFLPKTIDSVISDMAITFSGNIYMNLDIKTPMERINNIISLIEPQLIITNSTYVKNLENLGLSQKIVNIDAIDFDANINDSNFLLNRLSTLIDTDPYCIINTSGSTGTPKGVVLNHKSFVDFTEWSIDTFKFTNDEIIGSLSPLVFDIYSYELCMLMSKGSTIVLIPDSLAAFPIKILEILEKEKTTFLFWVPTIMVNIANMSLLENIKLPSLKTVWFAGEVFPTKQFNYWKNNLKNCLFANLYGPIEITLDCTYFIVDRDVPDNEPLPIGFACRNTDVLILDEDRLVTKGEEGELCVRGTSLAMGYYNNPEKTALAFVQNPLNKSYPEIIYRTGDIVSVNERDEIIFKGRKDSLIKHLGYRIELGEIEHVIVNTLKIAKNGCVVYNVNKKEITLFYEADKEISVVEFRKLLSNEIPKYMIPTVYIFMEELPRNTNGKIDRLLLKNKINE
ncbi:amino acid adenylation domain-containing protein [Flavobacterium sp. LHD-85]|uniref:amino acid adenylation domain-containing protein n=1 Tax=Flavobacterium sp. LHD-85 TaxID=3071410 RepID=UPI0027DFC119|nr:amino acid adenylation domain-containing protein [Flavobacterium sp. LHD-85]MDQ6529588.1 amino acid adenylation domain-containing protein [Flavobacterium sp. LHD-85]